MKTTFIAKEYKKIKFINNNMGMKLNIPAINVLFLLLAISSTTQSVDINIKKFGGGADITQVKSS